MKRQKTHTEWIRLVAPPEVKALLEEIQKQRADDGFSETVRDLIREEAARRNITASAQPQGQQVAA